MNQPARTCTACHTNPAPENTYMCTDCQNWYTYNLNQLPPLLHDLHDELTKQTRKTPPGGTRTPHGDINKPLPYNPAASALIDTIRGCLRVLTTISINGTHTMAIPAMIEACRTNQPRTAAHPAGGQHTAHLHRLITQAHKLTDNPPERIYLGACPCGLDLHTEPDTDYIQCPCGTVWKTQDVIDYRNTVARDRLLTVPEIARLLPAPRGTVGAWATRNRMMPRGHRDGVAVYAYGDALNLHAQRKTNA